MFNIVCSGCGFEVEFSAEAIVSGWTVVHIEKDGRAVTIAECYFCQCADEGKSPEVRLSCYAISQNEPAAQEAEDG